MGRSVGPRYHPTSAGRGPPRSIPPLTVRLRPRLVAGLRRRSCGGSGWMAPRRLVTSVYARDGVRHSASRLDALEVPMRLAFDSAWEALRADSVPVGAVVTDGVGSVVAIGRARSMDRTAEPGRLSNTSIAHAEIDALAQLTPGRHTDFTVWATLEPCILCTGALVIASIGAVRFAASDPLWTGLDRLPDLNAFVASRWPRRIGPRTDELGAFAMLLPLLFYRQRYPEGASI